MRKIIKSLAFLGAIAMCSTVVALPVSQVKADEGLSDFSCTYSATKKDNDITYYGGGGVETYTAEEAATAGVPDGYTDNVVKVVFASGYNVGVLLDFSEEQYPVGLVDSITFRVYIETLKTDSKDGYPEVRIAQPHSMGNWVMRYKMESTLNQWVDITLSADGTNFEKNMSFDKISVDGYLDKFELGLRANSSTNFYIDSVVVNYVENDGVAPVITYEGGDEITVTKGMPLLLNATAYDELDGEVEVVYDWGVEFEGETPDLGTYTLTLRATDFFGNVAEKQITVNVAGPDEEAPVITVPTEMIYAKTGTIPLISVVVTDNRVGVTYTQTWSDGAFNEYGGFVDGTHTLTIKAVDASGNESEKAITFYVSAEGEVVDNLIDEEVLTPVLPEPPDSSEVPDSSVEENSSDKNSSSSKEDVISSSKEDSSTSSSAKESSSEAEEESSKRESSKKNSSQSSEKIIDEEALTSNDQNQMKLGCVGSIAGATVLVPLLAIGVVMMKKKDE